MHDKLSVLGADLLKETLPSIIEGTNESVPQDDTQATFASNIRREDERISWNKPGRQVFNQIRGLSPWPVAYTTMDDTNLKIYDAELVETNKINEPGTIIETTKKPLLLLQMIMKLLQLKICNWLGKENVSCQLFKWCAKHTSREETYMIENVRSLAFDTIQDILNEGAYSNLRINEVLSENELNAMDKALFTEIVYGTVKRKYTLDFYLKPL